MPRAPSRAAGREGASTIAAAARVAIVVRSDVGERPWPSGCSRLVRMTTNVSVSGSIQRLVPVKPVWPKLVLPKSAPRGEL